MTRSGTVPEMLFEDEAAAKLRISIDTLRRIRKRGEITSRKISGRWRYTDADLMEYQESQKVESWVARNNESAKSPDTGSLGVQSRRTGMRPGTIMTAVNEARVAHHLAQTIFGKPK